MERLERLVKFIESFCGIFFGVCALLIFYWSIEQIALHVGVAMPNRTEWPAWAQAVGTIATIGVAFWVGDRSASKARKQAEDMQKLALDQRHSAICAILDNAYMLCNEITPEFDGEGDFGNIAFSCTYNARNFNAAISALEKIPLHDMDSYNGVKGIEGLRNSMVSLSGLIEEIGKYVAKNVRETFVPEEFHKAPDEFVANGWAREVGKDE